MSTTESGIISSLNEHSESQKNLQQFDFFDANSLKTLVSGCGFKVIDSGSYFIKPFTHKQMNFLIEKKQINNQVLDGLNKLSNYIPDYGAEIYVTLKIN